MLSKLTTAFLSPPTVLAVGVVAAVIGMSLIWLSGGLRADIGNQMMFLGGVTQRLRGPGRPARLTALQGDALHRWTETAGVAFPIFN